MKTFYVNKVQDLDSFDAWAAYYEHEFSFEVVCEEDGKVYTPSFGIDKEGYASYFEGWNYK